MLIREQPTLERTKVNHKRRRPASSRAGCKLCKPYKDQRFSKARARREIAGKGGFGKIRQLRATADDMRNAVI
jgi:hypothetical protein